MCLSGGTPLLSTVGKEEGGGRKRQEEKQNGQKGEGPWIKGMKAEGYRKRSRVRGWDKRRFSAAVELSAGSLTLTGT